MKFFIIEPEVAGGLGDKTVFENIEDDLSAVVKLHYEFDDWLGDELLEATPCFIVTERLAKKIEHAQLTGVTFGEVDVSTSDLFADLNPGARLPVFVWLKVWGTAGKDDFSENEHQQLVLSERALQLIQHQSPLRSATIHPV